MGILSDIGDAFTGGLVSAWGASKQRKHARKEAQKMRDFQERMSNTAVQRRMADLKEAGINPILAGVQGGASSPAGAMAPVNDPIGAGLSTARQRLIERQQIKNMKETGRLTKVTGQKVDYEAGKAKAEAAIASQNAYVNGITSALDAKIMSGPLGETFRTMQLGGTAAGGLAVASAVGASRAVRNLKSLFNRKKESVTDIIKHGPNLTRKITR